MVSRRGHSGRREPRSGTGHGRRNPLRRGPGAGRRSPRRRGHGLRCCQAIRAGLHVDSGLHDFLSEDPEDRPPGGESMVCGFGTSASRHHADELHFFSGEKIDEVESIRIALLGTDSAVGKRTTAWVLVDALSGDGHTAELIGTGQTSWMQGARYGIVLDSLVNDFVSGEIEHAIWRCWREQQPGR